MEVIDDWLELFDMIAYDWIGSHHHPSMRKHRDRYTVNKIDIFEDKGKYYVQYKTEMYEITEELFTKTGQFFDFTYE